MRRIQLCIGILQFVLLFWGINVSDAKAKDTKQYSDEEGGWDLQMLQWSVSYSPNNHLFSYNQNYLCDCFL